MRDPVLRAFHRSGLAALSRRVLASRGRFVVELHGVHCESADGLPPPLRPSILADDLRHILRWIGLRFPFLGPEEFLGGRSPGVLLTFDDGFANQANVALPLLEEYGVPAVFFVTTRHVEEPTDWLPFVRRQLAEHGRGSSGEQTLHHVYDGMSVEELRRSAESPWITIGSHSVSHPLLTRCDDESLARELRESRSRLEEWTGAPVDLFAYPTGDYDARVAAAARQAGYRAAFVEESRGLGLGDFEIPRIGLYRSDSAYLAAKLSGLHRRPLTLREASS